MSAAHCYRWFAAQGLTEQAVIGIEYVAGFGMMAGLLFRGFFGMAFTTILRRDNYRDIKIIVFYGISFPFLGQVTFIATDAGLPMS